MWPGHPLPGLCTSVMARVLAAVAHVVLQMHTELLTPLCLCLEQCDHFFLEQGALSFLRGGAGGDTTTEENDLLSPRLPPRSWASQAEPTTLSSLEILFRLMIFTAGEQGKGSQRLAVRPSRDDGTFPSSCWFSPPL